MARAGGGAQKKKKKKKKKGLVLPYFLLQHQFLCVAFGDLKKLVFCDHWDNELQKWSGSWGREGNGRE